MSKIEEALKKARALRTPADAISKQSSESVSHRFGSNIRDLIPARDTANAIITRETSSKEIALMKHGEPLDNNQLSELRIIHPDMTDSKVANTYRDLRTKLIQKSGGRNFIAMLTSCVPGDESSQTTLNLASAFSFDESKTSLLIDCNINNPRLDGILELNNGTGLTDYLENEHIDVEKILHPTGIKRLKIIPAGTARESSTEYFTSMRMRQLMAGLLSRYNDRYIFLDAAPITESADTRILAEFCDFVILVVPYGKVTKNRIKEAAAATGKDKLLGVVFMDMPQTPKLKMPNFNRFFGV